MGEENKRVEASLTRGLEALHQLEAKLVFHETPLPSLEEPSVECPVSVTLSEHLASLESQNKDLEETMREKEEDEDKVEELGGDEEENERHDVRIWRAE